MERIYTEEPNRTKPRRQRILLPELRVKQQKTNRSVSTKSYDGLRIKYVKDKLQHRIYRGWDIRGWVDSLNTQAVYAAGIAVILMLCMTALYGVGVRFGYAVYAGDQKIASVADQEIYQQAYDQALTCLQDCLGEEFAFEQQPVLRRAVVYCKNQDVDTVSYQLLSSVSDVVEAIAVRVDGKLVTAFADERLAELTVNRILERAAMENPDAEVSFAEEVELLRQHVPAVLVQEPQKALEILTGYREQPVTHTVADGESLWSISRAYGVSVDDLVYANPTIDAELIQPGDTLQLTRPVPVLAIQTVQVVNYEQEIAYETQQIADASMYQGRVSVSQEGHTGKRWVEAKVTRIDGIEVASEILQEQVLEHPVAQVEYVGTKERPATTGSGSFSRPYSGAVSSRFGYRWGRQHAGVDLSGRTGDPIYAADGGKIISSGYDNGGYGYMVIIDHENGYKTYYAHCSQLLVSAGDRVVKGELIAKVGSTGNSTGPHLHFEVRLNGTPVDPMSYVN